MRVLLSGVDTLEGSSAGQLADGLSGVLEELKRRAQDKDCPQDLDVAGYPLVVAPNGLKPWRYLVKGDDLHLRLSGSRRVPTASVRLLALGLVALGHEGAWSLAERLLAECGDLEPARVSRIDLYADVQGFTPDAPLMRGMVCDAVYRGLHLSGDTVKTFQYGKGDMVCRVYDKTAELASSGKGYLRAVWAEEPEYCPEEPVWRIEYQMRREWLRARGMLTVRDSLDSLHDLWRSALSWAELRVPEGENSGRWPVHPAWESLAGLAPAGRVVPAVKAISRVESFEAVVPQALGLLVSGAAAVGLRDLDAAVALFWRSAEQYLERRDARFPDLVKDRARQRLGSG